MRANPSTEEPIARASSAGADFGAALAWARDHGGPALRELTFAQRGELLKEISAVLDDGGVCQRRGVTVERGHEQVLDQVRGQPPSRPVPEQHRGAVAQRHGAGPVLQVEVLGRHGAPPAPAPTADPTAALVISAREPTAPPRALSVKRVVC